MRRWRHYLIFAPSAVLGLLAVIWLQFRPFPYVMKVGPLEQLLVTLALILGFLAAARLLERILPSFRYASQLLERALSGVRITIPFALTAALVSAVAEELFFRAALMPLLGVWGQALIFGLMHPAPRKAWSYTVFTFVAGLAFGYATLYTGSLWPAIVAHFGVNLHGFLSLRQLQEQRRQRYATLQKKDIRLGEVPKSGEAPKKEQPG